MYGCVQVCGCVRGKKGEEEGGYGTPTLAAKKTWPRLVIPQPNKNVTQCACNTNQRKLCVWQLHGVLDCQQLGTGGPHIHFTPTQATVR